MDTSADFWNDRNTLVTDRILKHWLKEDRKIAKTGPHQKYKCRNRKCVWHYTSNGRKIV